MKILLAFDGFDYSQPALEETARLARERNVGVLSDRCHLVVGAV
jgi:hypothetical protein